MNAWIDIKPRLGFTWHEYADASGQVENWETSKIFFRRFLFRLFDFDPIPKIENSKEETTTTFCKTVQFTLKTFLRF